MTEWQFIVEGEHLPELPPEKPVRSRSSQRWFWLAGAIIALLVTGVTVVYRQREERRIAIREDLTTFIFAEETSRFRGDVTAVPELVIPTAPADWQQAYRQTFQSNYAQSPPTAILLKQIDFDGQCARIEANLDGYDQVRAYCLHERRWRRAPIPLATWGDDLTVLTPLSGVRLGFQPCDQAFAAELAGDLPQLLTQLKRWSLWPPTAAPAFASERPLEIIIEPRDLHGPFVSDDDLRLVLNSPLLVPADGSLPNGQVAVRLALVQALLHRTSSSIAERNAALPGVSRFEAGIETVLAAHLILPREIQQQLAQTWQAQLNGQWISPFFAELLFAETATTPQQAQVAADLLAEQIYRLKGPDALVTLLHRLPAADSWDSLFQPVVGRSTVTLENKAAVLVQGLDPTAATITPANNALSAPDLPLQATLLQVQAQTANNLHVSVTLSDQAEPVLVDLSPGLYFSAPNGLPLPFHCIPPGTKLEIKGSWLEIRRRQQASQVLVQEINPLKIEPAPADTVAYLLQGQPLDDPNLATEYVFPSNRSFFITDELLVPQTLVALRQDGTIQPLTPLSSTLRAVPLPIMKGESVHFLLILDLPGCERSWFVHYEPARGVTGRWLGPPQPMKWVWRADRQDLMFFDSRPGGEGHNLYLANDLVPVQPISQSDIPVLFTGWQVKEQQLVFTRTWMGATGIGLLEPISGDVRRVKLYIHPLRARRLSLDGNWLAYLVGVRNLIDPPYRLDVLNLTTLTETTLIRGKAGEGLSPAEWSPYLAQPRLAVLAGPLADRGTLRPTRLLLFSPDQPENFTVLTEAGEGEQLALPVFCADGSLLYRVERDDHYQLMRQQPGQRADLLFTRDQPFQPLACP